MMTKCATWMPFGPSSRAALCARTTQRKLAHRKSRGMRVALNAGTRPSQQDRATPVIDHPPRRLPNHQETAERGDLDRLSHGFRIKRGNRAVRAGTSVVEHDVGLTEPLVRRLEQLRDGSRIGRISGEPLGADLGC